MIDIEDGRYERGNSFTEACSRTDPLGHLRLNFSWDRVLQSAALSRSHRRLRKATEQLPDSVQAQYGGLALYQTGAWRDWVPYFEFVAKKRPKWPDAQYSLASVYARTQHVPEAVELLQTVLQLNPQHFRANLLLGRILTLQHRASEALPYLKEAASIEPDNFEPHAFLADALEELGDGDSAKAERARAQALRPQVTP
jgi:predicted Zn-dependent protease